MTEQPRFSVREIELYERPVVLRLPFRFGVVTLTQCPQAFARARIELEDGKSEWGAAAEMMAPKWFDKNLQLSNEDNFEQLRDVLRMARQAYLSDASSAHGLRPLRPASRQPSPGGIREGLQPAAGELWPGADRPRDPRRALPRERRLLLRGDARQLARHRRGRMRREFAGFDFDRFLPALQPSSTIEARHTVGMLDAITAADLHERVGDGLPETLEEVIQACGHRYFKLKVGGQTAADLARLEAIAAVLDRSTAALLRFAGRQRAVLRRARAGRTGGGHPRPAPPSRGCGTPSSSSSSRSPASWRWTPTCARPIWASR